MPQHPVYRKISLPGIGGAEHRPDLTLFLGQTLRHIDVMGFQTTVQRQAPERRRALTPPIGTSLTKSNVRLYPILKLTFRQGANFGRRHLAVLEEH